MSPACPIRIKWRKNVCNFCTTRINRPCALLYFKFEKKSFFLTIAFMAVLNFKNKKLAFAIAKPIEYLMPKMCLS